MPFRLLLIVLSIGLLASCNKEDQAEIDKALILEYIETNRLDALEHPDGLYYVIEREGTGQRPSVTDEVKVDYEGFLLDGRKFDSSIDRGNPITFSLTQVISGWQIGIPLFREGGKGKLILPSRLAYGSRPPAGSIIPSNAVLVFDVTLYEVR